MFNRNITREEWDHFSKKFIECAAKDVNNARSLRSYIDMLLKQVTEDLLSQYNVTNESFRRRIQETREAKVKLENEHHEVIYNINSGWGDNKFM
jgi:tektin-1